MQKTQRNREGGRQKGSSNCKTPILQVLTNGSLNGISFERYKNKRNIYILLYLAYVPHMLFNGGGFFGCSFFCICIFALSPPNSYIEVINAGCNESGHLSTRLSHTLMLIGAKTEWLGESPSWLRYLREEQNLGLAVLMPTSYSLYHTGCPNGTLYELYN